MTGKTGNWNRWGWCDPGDEQRRAPKSMMSSPQGLAMKSSSTTAFERQDHARSPVTSVGVLVSQHTPQKKLHLYGILPFITGKFTCYSRRYQVSWSPRHHQHLGQIVPFLVPQLCLFLSPLDTSSQWLALREFYWIFIIKHGWFLQTIINNMDLTWYQ